jgi:hypothetical protein
VVAVRWRALLAFDYTAQAGESTEPVHVEPGDEVLGASPEQVLAFRGLDLIEAIDDESP